MDLLNQPSDIRGWFHRHLNLSQSQVYKKSDVGAYIISCGLSRQFNLYSFLDSNLPRLNYRRKPLSMELIAGDSTPSL